MIGPLDVYPAYYTYQLYKKFGNELNYSSSDDPDLSMYDAARREDDTLTVMVINLVLEEKTKPFRFGNQAQVRAEAWLFDPDHKAESIGVIELSGSITVPAQSITLYTLQK